MLDRANSSRRLSGYTETNNHNLPSLVWVSTFTTYASPFIQKKLSQISTIARFEYYWMPLS